MSDRGRVVLIFVVIGLVVGGGGYYFFKIYRPAQDLKNAQAEITGWETRFQGVRDCLLGKTPGSTKTSEALAIREMAPDPWDRGRCTPLISKLNRGEAPDTGIRAIEDAWVTLEKAASKAAMAFARHVSESTTLEENPLPQALDDLDGARLALRTAAKMPATQASGKPLTAAQLIPIKDGNDRLTALHVEAIPSAHGIVLFGNRASGGDTDEPNTQIKLTAGAAPEVRRIAPGSFRAVPDMSWAAKPIETEVKAGAVDVEGMIAAPSAFPMENPTIAAITGTLNDGVLVYGNATELVVARAKGGTLTPGAPIKIKDAQAGLDVDGRIALVWGDETATKGQILKPGGADEPVVELPPSLGQLCLTADRAWTQTYDTAYSFGGGRPTFKKTLHERLQGCTPEAALFHSGSRADTLVICTDDCRSVKIPANAPQHATTTVVGGKLVAIASHSGVLGVWREGAEPVFYALPETATPVLSHEWPAMALTDGKVIDVLARGKTGFLLIRIPAT